MAKRRCGLAAAAVLSATLASLPCAVVGDSESCPRPTCSGALSASEFLQQVASPAVYDKSLRPPCSSDIQKEPTIVEVQFKLNDINGVNVKSSTIDLLGFLNYWWEDPRLAFNGTSDGGCFNSLKLKSAEAQAVWTPDMYIDNLVDRQKDGFTDSMKVYPNGTVFWRQQVLLTLKATLKLGKLPYDEHMAKIVIASYSRDISEIRLVPRFGKVGAGVSGIGIDSDPIRSSTWELPNGDDTETGFETSGEVEVVDGWDYLTLSFPFKRRGRFYVLHVVAPSVVLLLLSYIAFWVDPDAVPARAFLAVIPVLIMRTMGNAIFATLPQGSQRMWLEDFVVVAMVWCVLASCEFAVVMYLRQIEKRCELNLTCLTKAKKVIEEMYAQSRDEGISLGEMLEKYKAQVVSKDEVKELKAKQAVMWEAAKRSAAAAKAQAASSEADHEAQWESGQVLDAAGNVAGGVAGGVFDVAGGVAGGVVGVAGGVVGIAGNIAGSVADPGSLLGGSASGMLVGTHSEQVLGDDAKEEQIYLKAAPIAIEKGVQEYELTVIRFAHFIFEKFNDEDDGSSDKVGPEEVRKAFTFFNIYKNTKQMAHIMCMFLLDNDMWAPEDEDDVQILFSTFTRLLISIDKYTFAMKRSKKRKWQIVEHMQELPPSARLDLFMRIFFLALIVMYVFIFYCCIGLY